MLQRISRGEIQERCCQLPDDASAQDILLSVPVHDAQAAMRSALAAWVGVVRERARALYDYNAKHAQAHAEVLHILDQIVRDADGIGRHRLRSKSHWHGHVYVPPLGSGYLQLASIADGHQLYQTGLLVQELWRVHRGDCEAHIQLSVACVVASWLSRRVSDFASSATWGARLDSGRPIREAD